VPDIVPSTLPALLDVAAVARLAGPRSLERGEEYAEWGAVGRLRVGVESVAATVQGTDAYEVRIAVEGGALAFGCSCPVGAEGAFCKHCVAVALCWLGEDAPSGPTSDDVRAYLLSLDHERLVDLLMEHARDDGRLDERLHRLSVRHANGGGDVTAYRAMIDRAFTVHGFVGYRDAYDYFAGIDETVDALDELLATGRPDAVIDLVEHALRTLAAAIERVDDSGGGTQPVVERIEELHHQACVAARPDPVALAERLLAWELDGGDLDIFDRAVVRYADALGQAGLDRYRKLAEEHWSAVPALHPGDSDASTYGRRFRITRIMEALAEESGDLEEQVAVRSRDLSHGYHFLRIAELCLRHDATELALQWAERGLEAFPERPDPRLRAFVADRYRRDARWPEALELSWLDFADRPSLESYKQLKADAERLGEWETRRIAALDLLRERATPPSHDRWAPRRDHSELVRIFLWEGDDDTAWEEARSGACSAALWLELAAHRSRSHPHDALDVYERQVELAIAGRDRRAYQEAVALMGHVRSVLEQLGDDGAFPRYVARVREQHKRKRNLVKLLDQLA
jgi:uncharacterized Zn finger protein